jgi:hypothetical protein
MNKMENHDQLKAIIDEVLQEFPESQLPPSFTDALMRKLENRLYWREVLAEFGLKIGLVVGALATLSGVLFFPRKNNDISIFTYLLHNWQIIGTVAIVLFFTFFFDQVFLRFLFRKNRS